MTPTDDPTVVIENRGPDWVIYRSLVSARRWIIRGVCNCCGACEVGAINPYLRWTGIPVGQPGAAVDVRGMDRPDSPVLPEIAVKMAPHCTLSGEWL